MKALMGLNFAGMSPLTAELVALGHIKNRHLSF